MLYWSDDPVPEVAKPTSAEDHRRLLVSCPMGGFSPIELFKAVSVIR